VYGVNSTSAEAWEIVYKLILSAPLNPKHL
jgi:hypothetical protein